MANGIHEIQDGDRVFFVPDPFSPITYYQTLILQGQRLSPDLVELVGQALFINRIRYNKNDLELKGGEILSRNDEMAKNMGADVRDPDQRFYLVYGDIYKAIRGLLKADQTYHHKELPELDRMLAATNDLQELGRQLNDENSFYSALFAERAARLALELDNVRNQDKRDARDAFAEAAQKTKGSLKIELPGLRHQIEHALIARQETVRHISDRLRFRVEVLRQFMSRLHTRIENVDTACRDTLDDSKVFGAKPDPDVVQRKLARIDSFAKRIDAPSLPRPHCWMIKHAKQDLTTAVEAIREGGLAVARDELEKVQRSTILVFVRSRLEEMRNQVSLSIDLGNPLSSFELKALESDLEKEDKILNTPGLEKGFKKPVCQLASRGVRSAIEHIQNPAELDPMDRTKSVDEALELACKAL